MATEYIIAGVGELGMLPAILWDGIIDGNLKRDTLDFFIKILKAHFFLHRYSVSS